MLDIIAEALGQTILTILIGAVFLGVLGGLLWAISKTLEKIKETSSQTVLTLGFVIGLCTLIGIVIRGVLGI